MTSPKKSLTHAASLMGAVGGSQNTPAQTAARIENAAIARASRQPPKNECGHPDRKHHGRGRCRNCYATLSYHEKHPDAQYRNDASILERFMSHVVQLADEGCWIWTGNKKPEEHGAYPLFRDPRERSPRHAVAWAFENIRGTPAPKRGSGLELSHQPDRCRFMSRCANPAHVEIESRQANLDRRDPEIMRQVCANARAHKGPQKVKSHCRNGHARTPDNLTPERRCKACIRVRHQARHEAVKPVPTLKIPVGSVTVAENTRAA